MGGTHTFIVALTASYLPEKGQILYDAGMDNYISKPFEVEHIQRLLRYSSRALVNSSSSTDAAPVDEESQKYVLDTHLGIRAGRWRFKRIIASCLLILCRNFLPKLSLCMIFCEARDTEKLSRAAHNLKGVAANLGARQLSNLAHRLEEQSNEGYTDGLRETIKDFEIAANILSGYGNNFLNNKDN